MNCCLDISAILTLTGQIDACLLAVAITLVVFIPALVELARTKAPDFLSGEDVKRRLKSGLINLQHAAWLFGLTTLLSVLGLLWQNVFLLALVLLLSFVSLVMLVSVSYIIASIARSVI